MSDEATVCDGCVEGANCTVTGQANKAIMHERHPFSTVEDVVQKLNNARVFNKTFSTHDGFYALTSVSRVRVKCSRMLLQMSGTDGSVNMSDDVFVLGKGESDEEAYVEHDKYLDQVLKRFEENELKSSQVFVQKAKSGVLWYGILKSNQI